MQIYQSPEEGNHRYQRQLATALADGLGLDAGLKTAQSNGWEGVLDALLGKRSVTSRRSTDLDSLGDAPNCNTGTFQGGLERRAEMKKLLLALALFAGSSSIVAAQMLCVDRVDMLDRLASEYGEELIEVKMMEEHGLLEVLKSPTRGTWTQARRYQLRAGDGQGSRHRRRRSREGPIRTLGAQAPTPRT